MKRRASWLAGALLLVLPSQALAQQANCRTIRALTNADRRDFDDLRFAIGSASLTLRSGARAPDLEGPTACEIRSAGDQRDIDCRWRFYDLASATDFYDNLLVRMRTCIPDPMAAAGIATQVQGWQVIRRNEALIGAEFTQTKVELSLVDATRRPDPDADPIANHYVQLTVEFEQGD